VSLTCVSGRAFADPLSAQPLIGVAAEYSSNPLLLADHAESETTAALLVNAPVNYDLDKFHFAATPAIRYSDQGGYSSLTSDYYHFDASAQYMSDLGSATLTGSFYRDSSLLYAGELANDVGVRRDTSTVDFTALRYLSERMQLQADVNTSRTLYDENTAVSYLVDYRYTSFSPALIYQLSERDTLKLIGSGSRYYALDDVSSSNGKTVQIEWDRKLTEIWSSTASVGYSKSNNVYNYYYGPYLIASVPGEQNSTVYSASVVRQTEQLALSASASQALAPTGLAFLSRSDTVNLLANYQYSVRWTLNAGLIWQDISTPLIGGGSTARQFYNLDLSAQWKWTEQWTIAVHVARIEQRLEAVAGQPGVNPASNNVSLEISRQFYRTNQ
jgi:hypothetical protein